MATQTIAPEMFVAIPVPDAHGGGWSVFGNLMPSGASYEDRRCLTRAEAEAHRDALNAGTAEPRISRVLRTPSIREAAVAARRAAGIPAFERSLDRRGKAAAR